MTRFYDRQSHALPVDLLMSEPDNRDRWATEFQAHQEDNGVTTPGHRIARPSDRDNH